MVILIVEFSRTAPDPFVLDMSIKVLSSLALLTDPFFTITKKLASQLWPAFVWRSVTPALFYLRGKIRESRRRNKMIISLLKITK